MAETVRLLKRIDFDKMNIDCIEQNCLATLSSNLTIMIISFQVLTISVLLYFSVGGEGGGGVNGKIMFE